jgi:mannitol-specific phosphotransferase system IIBC component
MKEFTTNLVHIVLGYISAKIPWLGILIAASFTAYEYIQSKNLKELMTDYLEFMIGIMLGKI